jgi:hypothetical protein
VGGWGGLLGAGRGCKVGCTGGAGGWYICCGKTGQACNKCQQQQIAVLQMAQQALVQCQAVCNMLCLLSVNMPQHAAAAVLLLLHALYCTRAVG